MTGLLVLAVSSAPLSHAAGRIDREGVYNLGAWFQYGLVEGQSRYGLDFSSGPGYSLHFRYNVSRKAALAVYFDNQSFDARADSLVQFKMTAVHGGVRFFSIPNGDVLRYVELTAGFYRPEIEFPKTQQQSIGSEFCFPGEGFLLHAGAGFEIFFTQAWAVEIGAHGYGLTGKGLCIGENLQGEKDFSFTGQIAIGLDYYLLR